MPRPHVLQNVVQEHLWPWQFWINQLKKKKTRSGDDVFFFFCGFLGGFQHVCSHYIHAIKEYRPRSNEFGGAMINMLMRWCSPTLQLLQPRANWSSPNGIPIWKWFPYNPPRIHGTGIFTCMWLIFMVNQLENIPVPWILWVIEHAIFLVTGSRVLTTKGQTIHLRHFWLAIGL